MFLKFIIRAMETWLRPENHLLNIILTFYDVPKKCQNFWSDLDDRTKTAIQKVAGVYIQASQSQTTGTKGSPVFWFSGNSGNREYGYIKPS